MTVVEVSENSSKVKIPKPYIKHVKVNTKMSIDLTWGGMKAPSINQKKDRVNKKSITKNQSVDPSENSISIDAIDKTVKSQANQGVATAGNEKIKASEKKTKNTRSKDRGQKKKLRNNEKQDEPKPTSEDPEEPNLKELGLISVGSELSFENQKDKTKSDTKKTKNRNSARSVRTHKISDKIFFNLFYVSSLSSPITYNNLGFVKFPDEAIEANSLWDQKSKTSTSTTAFGMSASLPFLWKFSISPGFRSEEYQAVKVVSDYTPNKQNLFSTTETKANSYGLWGDVLYPIEFFSWFDFSSGLGLDFSWNQLEINSMKNDEESLELGLLTRGVYKLSFLSLRIPIQTQFSVGPFGFVIGYKYSIPIYTIRDEFLVNIGIPSNITLNQDSKEDIKSKLDLKPSSSSSIIVGVSYSIEIKYKKRSKRRKK